MPTPTQFRTIAGRWRDHVAASGIDKTLPKREQALAMMMFYAGFSASLDAAIEVAAFPEAEAVQLLQAMQQEVKHIAAVAATPVVTVTERPILFSAPMVRALLAGTKTQTRRVVKWRNVAPGLNLGFSGLSAWGQADGWRLGSRRGDGVWEERCDPTLCPYGQPGDRLWVRETFCRFPADAPDGMGEQVYYLANQRQGDSEVERVMARNSVRWKPSIHMPRVASRITLEVGMVRVQRLQDISEADARAEGLIELVPRANRAEGLTPAALCLAAAATVDAMPRASRRGFLAGALAATLGFAASPSRPWEVVPKRWTRAPTAREAYAVLWESINGPGSWASNPWAWAISFKTAKS